MREIKQNTQCKNMQQRWLELTIGGIDINKNNPYISQRIETIDEEATELLKDFVSFRQRKEKPYIWNDLIPVVDRVAAGKSADKHIKVGYQRLEKLTLAYSTPYSRFYKERDLGQEIIYALDFMYSNWYNPDCQAYGNWWGWEIGSPLALLNITVMLDNELTHEQILNYMSAIDKFTPNITTSTGANRIWKAIIIALRGVIIGDEAKIYYGRDAINSVLPYVEEGDGFYKDGSFIQHDIYGYTGNYGEALINYLSKLVFLLHDTAYEIVDKNIQNMYEWVLHSFEPLMHKGAFMDALRGRQISMYALNDHRKGHTIIEIVAFMSQFAPEPYATWYKAMVKYWIEEDWYMNFYAGASIYGIRLAEEIVAGDYTFQVPCRNYQFSSMDRVLHRRSNYSFMIAMHSKRIGNYECINEENLRGWHTGDGMTYLYDRDLAKYADEFWPTVDSHRLPGTSAIYGEEIPPKLRSEDFWAGGCTLESYGTAGMILESSGSNLRGKKSWFCFDDEIVAIGSDIYSVVTDEATQVETILENYKIRDDGTNNIIINGVSIDASTEFYGEEEIERVFIEGNPGNYGTGFIPLDSRQLKFKVEKRTDSYSSINRYSVINNRQYTKNYFTLWMTHDYIKDYAYIIVPETTPEKTDTYIEKNPVEVIVKSSNLHAIKHKSLKILAANSWSSNKQTVEGITIDSPLALMVKEHEEGLTLTISDPTWQQQIITIELDGNYLLLQEDRVQCKSYRDSSVIKVDVGQLRGQSVTVNLKRY